MSVLKVAITPQSKELFLSLAADAPNWSGNPLFDGGKIARGNLTQLKKAGLVTSYNEEGNSWVSFTALGVAYAAENDILLGNFYEGSVADAAHALLIGED